MTYTRLIVCAAFTLSLSSAALAAMTEPSLQDKQQAACAPDVQRLCGSAIPDVDKVTACMATKKAQVSPECAKMYDAKK